jgi:hypothetical protein
MKTVRELTRSVSEGRSTSAVARFDVARFSRKYAEGVTDLSLGSAAQRRHPRETDSPTLRHHYVFC